MIPYFELIQEKAALALPSAAEIGPGVSEPLYEVLKRSLARDPAERDLDLAATAGWAAPLDAALLA